MTRLEDLNLSNNYIADDQLLFLKNLSHLKNVSLSNNNLKTNTVTTLIKTIPSIKKLNLSNNHLEVLEFEYHSKNLTHLELDSNKIREY